MIEWLKKYRRDFVIGSSIGLLIVLLLFFLAPAQVNITVSDFLSIDLDVAYAANIESPVSDDIVPASPAFDHTNTLDSADTANNGDFTFTDRAGNTSDTVKAHNTAGEWCEDNGSCGTQSGGTGPQNNCPPSQSGFIYTESSTPAESSTWAIKRTTSFDSTVQWVYLDIYYNMYTETTAYLYVEYATVASPNETTDWTVLESIQSTGADSWISDTFDFSAISTTTLWIRIRCYTDNNYTNDIALSTWREYSVESDVVGTPVVDDFTPFEFEQTASLTPAFRFSATDPDGTDDLHYHIQIDDDPEFGSSIRDDNSSDDPSYFENIDTPADTPPFNEGETIEYVPPSNLDDDTVYYWRVQVKEADTGYGDWMELQTGYYYSISTDDSLTISRWFQTTGEQFATGSQTGVSVSGGEVILNASGSIGKLGSDTSGTGTAVPLQFDHTLVSGSNRLVVVFVGAENGATYGTWSATYGGQSMTLAVQAEYVSSYYEDAVIFYILEADLPSDGSNQVLVTFTGSASSLEVNALCAEYENITQGPPDGYDDTGQNTSPITNEGLSASSGDLCVSSVSSGNAGTSVMTHDQSQNELLEFGDGSSVFACTDLIATGSVSSLNTTVSGSINRLARATAHWSPVAGGSGSLVSRSIDYDWLSGASDWNQLIFNDTEGTGDIKYDIEYWDGDSWEDTSVVNQDSSPVDISGLDGTTHNQIRIEANFSDPGTPSLQDWAITWTTGCVEDVTSIPDTYPFGVLDESDTAETAINYFMITNNSGGEVSITIHGTDFLGTGTDWDLSDDGSVGTDIYGLWAGLDDDDDLFDIVVREDTPYNPLISGLPNLGTAYWGLKLYMPSSITTKGDLKTAIITLVASCD